MSDQVDSEELRELVGAFRSALQNLERGGVYGVSGLSGRSETAEADDDAEQSVATGHAPDAAAVSFPEPVAAQAGDDSQRARTRAEAAAAPTLSALRQVIGDCQRCTLSQSRTHIVFGAGSETASLMFIGEAPGAEEDRLAEPFVGASGQLLDKMIVAMGWSRESVYIANVVKCRPPNNRDPRADEVAACEGFLARQIAIVQPAVIVTLGRPAAHLILETRASMGSLRGVWQEYSGVPVMPTYHPAYLLRDPSKKREAWADLQQVMAFCKAQGLKG